MIESTLTGDLSRVVQNVLGESRTHYNRGMLIGPQASAEGFQLLWLEKTSGHTHVHLHIDNTVNPTLTLLHTLCRSE